MVCDRFCLTEESLDNIIENKSITYQHYGDKQILFQLESEYYLVRMEGLLEAVFSLDKWSVLFAVESIRNLFLALYNVP